MVHQARLLVCIRSYRFLLLIFAYLCVTSIPSFMLAHVLSSGSVFLGVSRDDTACLSEEAAAFHCVSAVA